MPDWLQCTKWRKHGLSFEGFGCHCADDKPNCVSECTTPHMHCMRQGHHIGAIGAFSWTCTHFKWHGQIFNLHLGACSNKHTLAQCSKWHGLSALISVSSLVRETKQIWVMIWAGCNIASLPTNVKSKSFFAAFPSLMCLLPSSETKTPKVLVHLSSDHLPFNAISWQLMFSVAFFDGIC